MVCTAPVIQAQLSEALTIIGKHDFPQAWPDLLPKFYGVLENFDSLFKKFRYQFKTNDLLLDLKYCVDNYAEPLLEVFKWNAANIDHAVDSGANASTLQGYIESQTVCCSIFYSLNCMELQTLFEDHMDEWMIEFKKYLKNKYSTLEDSGDVGLALVDEWRAAVCENISLYVQKEDETFQDHLDEFLEALWPLLMVVSSSSKRERLTVAAIKFFTIVSTSVLHTFFAREDRLHQIFQDVVIPNVMLSDKDEVLFEQNYVEFIRRDMEGSALDTRRRIPGELLERIAMNSMNYKERFTKKASSLIQTLLDSFSQNEEANWKFKDCAIHLFISLATERAGSTSLFTDREEFFVSFIVQELRSKYGNPMLKASALKFFTMFRNQISRPDVVALFPYVMELLSSNSNVVRSYAAICIEKILMVKDEVGRSIYTISDIPRCLINFLFDALEMPESEENQYVMKCIMRVLGVVDVTRVAVPCIRSLVSVLNRVCVNPKNPLFNHYTFESVAGLIRRACEQDPSIISEVEGILLPVLRAILQENVSEFFPYAFQLLAIFVEMNRSPLPGYYKEFFTKLLLPEAWDKSANVPALVRLHQAFLRKPPDGINQLGQLASTIGIFNTMLTSPSTDEQEFNLLNSVIEYLDYDVISPYIRNIWVVLFKYLEANGTENFIKCLIIYMSIITVKHGLANLLGSMNAYEPNTLQIILNQYWIPHLKLITGSTELKLTSVASTVVLCDYLSQSGSKLWGEMLNSIVTLISRPEEDTVEEEPEDHASFINLYNARRREEDPLQAISDPKQFLVESLSNLSVHYPGKYPPIITENLESENQTALLSLCNFYKLSIA